MTISNTFVQYGFVGYAVFAIVNANITATPLLCMRNLGGFFFAGAV